ncbi:hypothetical protein ABIA33_003982 [Streptacidiphilus sp. MAP12-16]|uniref:SCO3933 family regulatory protein n=1 Tax=Streptacidiphilus sp. MAP12-16 TaxID=3156300 RepID=UPI003516D5FA
MPSFKIDLSSAFVFVAVPPTPKMKNKKTGEMAIDIATELPLYNVGLTVTDEGTADLLTVAIPESGIPADLGLGMPVAVTGLRARDWENVSNGEKRHGIAFRAVAITSLAPNGKG